MRILYVCTTTDRGGAENALRTLVISAQKQGNTVQVISIKPAGVVARELRAAGVKVLSLEVKTKFNLLQTAGALARLVGEIQTFQPDIVHAFLYRAIQLCRQAKKYIKFRLITTPHYDLSKQNCWKRLWDRALKNADDISCAESHQTAKFLTEKQKYTPEKVHLVCNGVDSSFFAPDEQQRARERKNRGFEPEHIVFCCVARLSKEKNHLLLLRAFAAVSAKNPKIRLLIVGDGPENANLRRFVRKQGLEGLILFTGALTDVRPCLCAADVFILPSRTESLPLALLEACACGLPCLVSKTGDMPLVVEHGQSGFVFNPTDAVVLGALMAEMAQNSELRKKMGKMARTRTEQKYPPTESKYLQLYQKMK